MLFSLVIQQSSFLRMRKKIHLAPFLRTVRSLFSLKYNLAVLTLKSLHSLD